MSAAGRAGGRRWPRLTAAPRGAQAGAAAKDRTGLPAAGRGVCRPPRGARPCQPLLAAEARGAGGRAAAVAAPPRGPGRGENGRPRAAAGLWAGARRGAGAHRPPGPLLPVERQTGSSTSPSPCSRGACKASQTLQPRVMSWAAQGSADIGSSGLRGDPSELPESLLTSKALRVPPSARSLMQVSREPSASVGIRDLGVGRACVI